MHITLEVRFICKRNISSDYNLEVDKSNIQDRLKYHIHADRYIGKNQKPLSKRKKKQTNKKKLRFQLFCQHALNHNFRTITTI